MVNNLHYTLNYDFSLINQFSLFDFVLFSLILSTSIIIILYSRKLGKIIKDTIVAASAGAVGIDAVLNISG